MPFYFTLRDEKQDGFFRTNVAIILIPGAFIYFTALAFFLVGSGLRDALDPKLKRS